jgi:hypothetical protein
LNFTLQNERSGSLGVKDKRFFHAALGCLAILMMVQPLYGLAEPLDHWQAKTPFTQVRSLRLSHGNGLFVAVGDSGTLFTSFNGAAWEERNSGTTQSLRDTAYGAKNFVAVGKGGTILSSPDGVTWTRRNSGTGDDLNGVGYGRRIFVVVGDHGAILTSSDGAIWTGRDSGTHQELRKVVFGGDTFVAVGDNGTLLTSSDGANWTAGNSGTSGHLAGIAYGRKRFVAAGDAILTSPDGIGWTDRTGGTTPRIFGIAYGSGVFAAAAENGAILTSADGTEWTPRDSATHLTLTAIVYGRRVFLASGEKGILLQSGALSSPQISVSSTSLDFGSVDVGNSSFTNLVITNSGSAGLIIRQISFGGADPLDFNSRNDACTGATLSPSQNCAVQIVFSPHSTGSKSGTLSISSNDPDTPTQTVSLSGTGTGNDDGGTVIIGSGSTGSTCFFSTSTKGTGLEDYLGVLRKFRDAVLSRSPLGRRLIDLYYQYSPALSRTMPRHEVLRKVLAIMLVPPLAAICYAALYASPEAKALLLILMIGVIRIGWSRMGRSRAPGKRMDVLQITIRTRLLNRIEGSVDSKKVFIMRSLGLFIACLAMQTGLGSAAFADTSIVVIRMPWVVVVGADSKTTVEGSAASTGTACKIYQAEDLFFAVAGLTNDAGRDFNAPAIIREAIRSESTLAGRVQAAEEAMIARVSRELNRLRAENPSVYARRVKAEGGKVLTLAFIGFQDGKSFALVRQFQADESNPVAVRVSRESCPGDCPDGVRMFFLGRHKAIERYLSQRSKDDPRLSLEEAVKHFIELEIGENPQEVGGPVDILRVDKDGARWIQKKDTCPAVQ